MKILSIIFGFMLISPIQVFGADIEVMFPQDGTCESKIVDLIEKSRHVMVMCYDFTNKRIAGALKTAHLRGSPIWIICDSSRSKAKYSLIPDMEKVGIRVYRDSKHKIFHHKVMIINGNTILTGSYNFTENAERGNAENLLIIQNQDKVSERYIKEFGYHMDHVGRN